MVNNKGHILLDGYGNAVKMSKQLNSCELQILLCKDQDAFIVSVGGKGKDSALHAFTALNELRYFIFKDSWGLKFQEFCLRLNYVSDQTLKSRVGEDFLDRKLAHIVNIIKVKYLKLHYNERNTYFTTSRRYFI